MSQLKFSRKIWNNFSFGGPTSWLRPWFNRRNFTQIFSLVWITWSVIPYTSTQNYSVCSLLSG